MCCSLNAEDTLRQSTYAQLVREMQHSGEAGPEAGLDKVPVTIGKSEGLRLTLDLHSNRVYFGTIDKDFSAFNVFIGEPAEFPVLR